MKTTLRNAAKACLVTAASSVLCSPAALLLAQEGSAPANQAVQQTRGSATSGGPQYSSESAEPETPLQRELRKKFQEGHRDMPSFNLADAPHTDGPTPSTPSGESRPASSGAMAASSKQAAPAPKPNWFERTFHVGRGKRKPAPVAESQAPAVPPAASPARRAPFQLAKPAPAARPTNLTPRTQVAATPTYQAPPSRTPAVTPPPLTAGTPPAAQPAQPVLREPAPLAPSPLARELTAQATPAAAPPTSAPKSVAPLLEEPTAADDSESLDLVDTTPRPMEAAPTDAASSDAAETASSESPYSGVRIAPVEEEKKGAVAADEMPDLDSEEDESPSASQQPAAAPESLELKPTQSRTGILPLEEDDEDEDDSDDDDDASPASPANKPRTLPEPAVLKAAKVLEKLGTPLAGGADSVAAGKVATSTSTPGATAAPAPLAPAAPAADPAASATPSNQPFAGFKGLCPVALKDKRKLVDAQPTIVSIYKGKTFAFSSPEAKLAFDENPQRYLPAGGGVDVVKQTAAEKKEVEGSLEHAAWYRGKLYLFSDDDSRLEFVEEPARFVLED